MNRLIGFAAEEDSPGYRVTITRDFPFWTAVLTGGDLPDAGQAMTSLSLARLQDDLTDWLKWKNGAPEFTIYDAPFGDDDDGEDAYHYVPGDEDDDEDPDPAPVGGFGWHLEYEFAFPQAVKDAWDRYWEAMKALRPAWDTLCETVAVIHDELNASAEDIGRYMYLPEKRVERILRRQWDLEEQRHADDEEESGFTGDAE
jgi:hypothetical protein